MVRPCLANPTTATSFPHFPVPGTITASSRLSSEPAYRPGAEGSSALIRILQFIALVLFALALVPAGAHLFAMPHKIHLAQNDYFIVQTIYRGWALFGIVLFGNLAALTALAIVQRGQTTSCALVLAALASQIATLVIFFTFVFPANQATANWTMVPAGWEQLRLQWEWGHAVDAVISFAGYCALVLSVLLKRTDKG